MATIKALHHVHLKCLKEQYEEVLRFYRDILGLRVLAEHPHCAILDTGSGLLEVFCDADKCLGQGDYRHIAFEVDDAAAWIKIVEEAGYKIKEHPINVMFDLEQPTPATIAFCYGPIGEEIEFFQIRK